VVADLCSRLLDAGVPALHFYTMNQSAPVLALCTVLGLQPVVQAQAHVEVRVA
ncbi:MAG: methylenetetrahydrofolate reductase, partial [Rhodoferax sp.]|nr:methylenetetrahydrofolate reductase [Rhodoferax sp.]